MAERAEGDRLRIKMFFSLSLFGLADPCVGSDGRSSGSPVAATQESPLATTNKTNKRRRTSERRTQWQYMWWSWHHQNHQ